MSTQLVNFWWYFTWGNQICWLIVSTRKRNGSRFRKTWAAMITEVPLQRLCLPLLHSESCYSKASWKEAGRRQPYTEPLMYVEPLRCILCLALYKSCLLCSPTTHEFFSSYLQTLISNVDKCVFMLNVDKCPCLCKVSSPGGGAFLSPQMISMCSICFIHFVNVNLAPSKSYRHYLSLCFKHQHRI